MKPKVRNTLRVTWGATALTLLLGLAATKQAQAYVFPIGCQVSGSIFSLTPSTPGPVHVGDTINYIVGLANPITDPSTGLLNCQVSNVTINLTLPNGTVLPIVSNVFLTPGDPAITCPSADPRCLTAGPYSYVVQTVDIHNVDVSQCPVTPGPTAAVSAVTHRTGVVHNGVLDAGLNDNRCANTPVIQPHISITKECVTNCPPFSSPYGQPINFTGLVINDGDSPICGIIVTDSPSATITFDATTTKGLPYPSTLAVCPAGGLTNGDSIRYHGSYQPSGNLCGPFNDTVTVHGNDILGTDFNASANATCTVCTTPCLQITKDCSPKQVTATNANQTVTVNISGIVTNCGNVPLTNVVITDSIDGGAPTTVTTIPLLDVGQSAPYTGSYQTTGCKTTVDKVHASADNICTGAVSQSNDAFCTNVVLCPPAICVTKQVACYLGNDTCGTFSNFAIGVEGDTQEPAFCYKITVNNCGTIPLTNVTIIDTNKYGQTNLTSFFFPGGSATIQPGGTVSFIFQADYPAGPNNTPNFVTNIVQACGTGNGQTVCADTNAAVEVIPASVECLKQYSIDGGPLTNNVTISDQNPHDITWFLTLRNTGLADLIGLVVNDVSSLPGCSQTFTTNLLAGATIGPITLCSISGFVCTNGVENAVDLFADHFEYQGNPVCSIDINGSNIVVRSQSPCETTLSCAQPTACRTTGGGRTEEINTDGQVAVHPDNVRYVTYGGQVGAPVGNKICVVTAQFQMGNPCIHGRWTHVRHQQGGLKGNFHARYYDTLDCACLDTNTSPVTVSFPGVDGAANQTYVNLVYGPGTTDGQVCNPGDKVAGPEPRKAPANKIVFTGVGDWADPNGRREGRATLFRVDLEDRSEPGGSHPKGGTNPPDRYRIRIWVLSSAELTQLNSGAGSDPYLLNFRNAISSCIGINVQDGASVPVGTAVFGVRAPDIDDGGEQDRGNHQIHPSIMSCDPNNPVGPGLPPNP